MKKIYYYSKCSDCGIPVRLSGATYCNKHKLTKDRHHNWTGGKPRCIDCGKQLARYKAKRCRKCRGLWLRIPENNWNFGRKFSKHGIKRTVYRFIRDCERYNEWRLSVFRRDGYRCKMCGDNKILNANHIKRFIDILIENNIKTVKKAYSCKELWDINNGITLCVNCHLLTYGKENQFTEIFNNIIKNDRI